MKQRVTVHSWAVDNASSFFPEAKYEKIPCHAKRGVVPHSFAELQALAGGEANSGFSWTSRGLQEAKLAIHGSKAKPATSSKE